MSAPISSRTDTFSCRWWPMGGSMNSSLYGSLAALAATMAAGCVFVTAGHQQEAIDATCVVSGHVTNWRKDARPIVVVLLRHDESQERPWRVADHFVLDQPGR